MAIEVHLPYYPTFPSLVQEIDGLNSMIDESPDDREMLDMVTEELGQAIEEEKRLQKLLLKSLLPRDDADERDSILEVRAGKLHSTHVLIHLKPD